MSDRPLPSSFDDNEDYNESALQKVTRKLKAEPLIPLGCLLTVGALANAWRAMRRGDHNQVQRMFRARVYAQGLTITAIVVGGIYYGEERARERELWKMQRAQADEEKRLRWIQELEARDAEDKALREKMDRRRRRVEKANGLVEEKAASGAVEVPTEDKKEGSTILAALGGLFGGKASEKAADGAENTAATDGKDGVEKDTEEKQQANARPEPAAVEKKEGSSALGSLGSMFSRRSAPDSPEQKAQGAGQDTTKKP